MKLISCLLVITSLCPSNIKEKAGVKETLGLKSLTITPLDMSNVDSPIFISYGASEKQRFVIKIDIINDLYVDGVNIFTKSATTSGNYVFHYKNTYTRIKNTIRITTSSGKIGTETVVEKEINLVSENMINLNDDDMSQSSTKYLTYSTKEGYTYRSEKLEFVNFYDYYVPDYYHKLDIRDFKIHNDPLTKLDLQTGDGYLILTNSGKGFEKLCGGKKSCTLNVEIINDGSNYYHLEFKDKLYVNKYDLTMSKTKEKDYVETKYIYFPRNGYRSQEDYNLMILLNGVGVNRDNFYLNFKFKAIQNLIGDCHNSEYCVTVE